MYRSGCSLEEDTPCLDCDSGPGLRHSFGHWGTLCRQKLLAQRMFQHCKVYMKLNQSERNSQLYMIRTWQRWWHQLS